MYERYEKTCCYIMMGLMVISLLILMYMGLYNHPTGDDYYYAVTTRQVLEETGSILQTFWAAARGVADQYMIWQGTYSAMFFMYLPPNVFGENAYRLVTAGILFLYTTGVFYLFKPFLCRILKGTKYLWCAVSATFVLLTIQTVPFQGESFFWYNGSMYYTGYLSLTFFFFGALSRYLLTSKRYYVPILWFGAVFLAGGNYVSLLPAILVVLLVAAVLLKRRSDKRWVVGLVAVLMLAGLLVSAAAPGNQVRGEGSIGNMSAVKAIALSLWQSVSYLEAWLDRWWVMTILVLTPLFWKSYKRISFSFPMPLLVVGLVHGIFCSMSCPTFYAQGSTGPARVVAIVYYGFMLSTLLNYYYLLGYLYRYLSTKAFRNAATKEGFPARKWLPVLGVAGFCLLFAVQIGTGKAAECSSAQALRSIAGGELQRYEEEYRERLKVLEDDTIKDVVFMPYETRPAMIYVGDFTPDPTNENNVEIAKYFGKDSIKVQIMD